MFHYIIEKCPKCPSVFWKPQDPWLPRAKAESPGVMADIREMLKDSGWNGTVVLHFFVKQSFTSCWCVVYTYVALCCSFCLELVWLLVPGEIVRTKGLEMKTWIGRRYEELYSRAGFVKSAQSTSFDFIYFSSWITKHLLLIANMRKRLCEDLDNVDPHILHAFMFSCLFHLCIAWCLCCLCHLLHWFFAWRACNHFVAHGLAVSHLHWTDFFAQELGEWARGQSARTHPFFEPACLIGTLIMAYYNPFR